MPQPDLSRIRELARLLNDPQLTYPSIHITGTNGKTTTASLVTALACAHGITAGTFISPHLTSPTERLSVCGEAISEEEFAENYGRLLPYLERVDSVVGRVTYFEALTALAYLWFSDKPVGLGVFEVGMGGTWDATNLVRGDVAILCPVGLDHRELGSTVEEVAGEKAGIIKEGRVGVIREQRAEAMKVIEERAADAHADLLLEGSDFSVSGRAQAVGGQSLAIEGWLASYPDVFLPLFGEETARNAAASVAACEVLLDRALDESAVRAALGAASSPGRVEVVERHPLVVLDGAHNPDAAKALAAALGESFRWERLHLVAGVFADKDLPGVLAPLAPLVDRAYACASQSARAAPSERIADTLRGLAISSVETFATVADAVNAARAEAEGADLILVTGSFYTVGEARPLFVGA